MIYTLYKTNNGGYMLSRRTKKYFCDTKWLGRYGIWWDDWKGAHFEHAVAKSNEEMQEWIGMTLKESGHYEGPLTRIDTFTTLNDVLRKLKTP